MGNNKDQELIEIFLEETTDLIASLSTILREWENDLHNLRKIEALKRDLHTLKGSARMVGQTAIGKLGHEMETLSDALAKGQINMDKSVFELINLGVDRIAVMAEAIRKHETPPNPDELIQKIYAYLPKTGAEKGNLSAKTPTEMAPAKEALISEGPSYAAEEMIRIRASLLETLNNLSTESNTIRVGFEQQVFTFGQNLRALRFDTKRLEGQLITLQSEIQSYVSEAEIFGSKTEGEVGPNIEFKRYSTLDRMSHLLHETSIDLVNTLKVLYDSQTSMESLLLNQTRISTELQHRLSDTRLVPFESILPRLSRIARQVSSELKKQVNFRILKCEGEMDRTILEHLIPSLEHILRNALDHGIESIEERRKLNKPDIGTIEVKFIRTGSIADIEVKDDGAGIDPKTVRKKALELGLLSPNQMVSDEEMMRYILEPGFSTRQDITELSGRGVGMDVVANAVKEMGGTLNIISEVGTGTRMIIRFPFTTSLNRTLLFSMSNDTFGFLLSDILGVINLSKEECQQIINNDTPILHSGDKSYYLYYLDTFLEVDKQAVFIPNRKNFSVILIPSTEFPLALMVDTVLYSRDLLVQSLGAQFKLVEAYSGVTLLGDGRAVYILDPEAIRKKAKRILENKQLKVIFSRRRAERSKEKPIVMVVDDSASARAVAKGFLERHHYQTLMAKDGVDAIQQLETASPNLLLIDVDMPRMNGLELASTLRQDSRYQKIPIIMISSIVTPERRRFAKELQLEGLMTKPYEEVQLLLTIQSLIGIPK